MISVCQAIGISQIVKNVNVTDTHKLVIPKPESVLVVKSLQLVTVVTDVLTAIMAIHSWAVQLVVVHVVVPTQLLQDILMPIHVI